MIKADRDVVKKASKKASKDSDRSDKPRRALHPSLVLFGELRNYCVKEFEVKNGVPAVKFASKILNDMRNKNPNLKKDDLVGTKKKFIEYAATLTPREIEKLKEECMKKKK